MTPTRLRECLTSMRWTNATLAEAFGCEELLVLAWMLGFEEIPMEAGAWIETLAQAHEQAEPLKPKSLSGMQLTGWSDMAALRKRKRRSVGRLSAADRA